MLKVLVILLFVAGCGGDHLTKSEATYEARDLIIEFERGPINADARLTGRTITVKGTAIGQIGKPPDILTEHPRKGQRIIILRDEGDRDLSFAVIAYFPKDTPELLAVRPGDRVAVVGKLKRTHGAIGLDEAQLVPMR